MGPLVLVGLPGLCVAVCETKFWASLRHYIVDLARGKRPI